MQGKAYEKKTGKTGKVVLVQVWRTQNESWTKHRLDASQQE